MPITKLRMFFSRVSLDITISTLHLGFHMMSFEMIDEISRNLAALRQSTTIQVAYFMANPSGADWAQCQAYHAVTWQPKSCKIGHMRRLRLKTVKIPEPNGTVHQACTDLAHSYQTMALHWRCWQEIGRPASNAKHNILMTSYIRT